MLPDTIHQAITDLRQELERVDYAIRQIEAVQEGKTLRGRPPKHAAKGDGGDAETSSSFALTGGRRP